MKSQNGVTNGATRSNYNLMDLCILKFAALKVFSYQFDRRTQFE